MMTMTSIRTEANEARDGIVRGYASLFDLTDLSGDEIAPGAFATSLARRGAEGVKMLWQHDTARPIGVWTRLFENRTGLFAEGRLALGTAGGREAHELILAGALDGLSIGFRTERTERPKAGIVGRARRRLTRIDLWEISIVTFPMQERARLSERRQAPFAATASELAGRFVEAAARIAFPPAHRPAWNKR